MLVEDQVQQYEVEFVGLCEVDVCVYCDVWCCVEQLCEFGDYCCFEQDLFDEEVEYDQWMFLDYVWVEQYFCCYEEQVEQYVVEWFDVFFYLMVEWCFGNEYFGDECVECE